MKRITTLLATLLIVFCFTNNVTAQLVPDVPSMKGRWVAGGILAQACMAVSLTLAFHRK